MTGSEGGLFNDEIGFRVGDQPPEARIGKFAVYGGTPADREGLMDGDPILNAELERQLRDALDGYGSKMHGERSSDGLIGRTPFDDLRDGDEG